MRCVRSETESSASKAAFPASMQGTYLSGFPSWTSSSCCSTALPSCSMSGSPCFACRTETKERKLRHLTKWAGAAVRMGQQGGQTEALWTHLDPSKPEEQRIMSPTCPDARLVKSFGTRQDLGARARPRVQLVGFCTQAGFCITNPLFIGGKVPSWYSARPNPLQQKVELRKLSKN